MARKKNTPVRYASIGLILALVACIASGLLTVFKGAVALGIYSLEETQAQTVNIWLLVSVLLIVLGFAIYSILAPDRVRRFLTGRQARYGSNSLIITLAFIGIIIVVNVLAFQNPKSLDLTEDKQHTLAPETIQALDTLPQKVTAIAFYAQRTPIATASQLLSDLKANSKGKFEFRFEDPEGNPVLARQYGVTGDGKIVLTMGDKKEVAAYASEGELVNAMIRLISPEQRTVYFLTGHGEPDINSTDEKGLSRARETLESKNYVVKTLNLAAENKIPADAKAVVVAGPVNPLLDQEVVILRAYVDKGGSLVVLEDPTLFTDIGENPDPLADYLGTAWGISLNNDLVIDQSSNQPFYAISAAFDSNHVITQHMTAITVMPESRSLSIASTLPKDVTDNGLIFTSEQAWGETDLAGVKDNKQISFDPTDIPGPLTLAAAGEDAGTTGRVVVFGSSFFATDQGFDHYANGDIFINSVDWSVKAANLVNITSHPPTERTFNLPTPLQVLLIVLGSVILIPGLVVAAGISTWIARRRQS